MTPPSNLPLSTRERSRLRGEVTRRPLVLVIISLTLALVLPRLGQMRIDRLRDETNQILAPAETRIFDILLEMAVESEARRGFLLTGDFELAAQIDMARSDRIAAEDSLVRAANQLERLGTTGVLEPAESLRIVDRQLDSLFNAGSRSQSAAALAAQRERFARLQAFAGRLRVALEHEAESRRRETVFTERAAAAVTAALVLLGLGAAFLVHGLGKRARDLALRLDEQALERERLLESERKSREAAEQRRVELERVTESRNRLLRGFTHDVKNPLGAADGYLALIEDEVMGPLPARVTETVSSIRRLIGQALELVGQLLDIARAEAGQLELTFHDVDVAVLLHDVAETYRPQADAKRLELRGEIPSHLPLVRSDATRVRQIVGNLVSNAVKYTPSGGQITVSCVARGDGGPPPSQPREVAIIVSDNGPGIAPDKLPTIFAEFARFDPRAAEGAGIGLAISQRIARALGGDITVESEPGRGSAFTLHLPLAAHAAKP